MLLADEFFLGTKLYHKKFTELCEPIFKYLDATDAIYLNIDKYGRIFNISNNYKWVERFTEEQYYKLDPLMVHPNNIHNGFAFDNSSEDEKFKDTVLYDAAVNFNCHHSFAYVEKSACNSYSSFVFAAPEENNKIINRLSNEAPIIKRLIRQLNKNLTLLIEKDLKEKTMDFAALKGEIFYSQKGLIFNEAEDVQNKIKLLQAAAIIENNDEQYFLHNTLLSPQEINCLRIYLTTPSIKQVARELNLSLTTISSYIENIKNKLNCTNKNDLLEKATILESLGYI